jgi:hypothetical protein
MTGCPEVIGGGGNLSTFPESRCNRAGYPAWVIIVAICFFPVGLLALLAERKPTTCSNCPNVWQA